MLDAWSRPPDGPLPVEKKFDPRWLGSLFEKGEPRVYTRSDSSNFDFIGMPVGGIGQGMLYLGGDGKLWRWDIFNAEIPDAESWYEPGVEYEHPLKQDERHRHPVNSLMQGFAIRTNGDSARTLDREGFQDITFRGAYPVGQVNYRDPECPLEVRLTAFSPFIPLDIENSTYPATILRFDFTNPTEKDVECSFAGWLENGNAWKTRHIAGGSFLNRLAMLAGRPALVLECQPDTAHSRNSDIGSQYLAFFSEDPMDLRGSPQVGELPAGCFQTTPREQAQIGFSEAREGIRPVGALHATFSLRSGCTRRVTCVLAWHNPHATNLLIQTDKKRRSATRFRSSTHVVESIFKDLESLSHQTLLWRDTWNDSTLPGWFLDRTFANAAVLASSTFYELADGRFYGYEGCYSCPGTCTHVYHYAQAAARLFPSMERSIRTMVDLGLAFDSKTGQIGTRGENADTRAVDGQAGTILRFYREHLLSRDAGFLRENWAAIRRSLQPLFAMDADRSGLMQGAQWNTLDTDWHGRIAWISGLYVAALRAGEAMARICRDEIMEKECRERAEAGSRALSSELFRKDYFINLVDPAKPETTNSGLGCHIDQVLGQSWAFQVGLPRVFEREQTLSALNALWRNNFTTDVGPYRKMRPEGRNYALPGEAGLLMCTFPDRNWDFTKASGNGPFPGYFNECMSGFEYQVASHMVWEGMTAEGLAIVRAIHDRYDGAKRNPWNEVECGSHYARAMASYGVYIAVCGYEYDGPSGVMGFAPRLHPERFKGAFTAASGWGSYAQNQSSRTFSAELKLLWGTLDLVMLKVSPSGMNVRSVACEANGVKVENRWTSRSGFLEIEFTVVQKLTAGQTLTIKVHAVE